MSVIVRAVSSEADVRAVVDITAAAFPEEAKSTQMPAHKWRELHLDDWMRQPWLWKHAGVACEGYNIIGTVVLTIDEEDGSLSYWQISKRVGCIPTLWTMAYDSVLEDPIEPHEALIDFIAVTPDARGKGVGSKLLQWAEETATRILAERCPESVQAQQGILMSLWVANNNATARKLYEKSGYETVKSTSEQPCSCFSACILHSFLGDSVWHKMAKSLPAPEHLKNKNMTTSMMAPMTVDIGVTAGGVKCCPGGPVTIVNAMVF